MPAPLIAPRWRAAAIAAVLVAVAVTAWLSVTSYHAGTTGFDNWAVRTSSRHLGTGWARVLIDISEPWLTFGVLVVVGVAAAIARRWDLVLLAAVGPGAAVLLTEHVLKPLISRRINMGIFLGDNGDPYIGAFPSGHETGVTAAAIVVLIATAQLRLRPATRRMIVVLLGAWVLLTAAGLVRNVYHYATDTIGGAAVSIAVVLVVALLLDRWYPATRERLQRRQLARSG